MEKCEDIWHTIGMTEVYTLGLTFACMNLKKLAKMIARRGKGGSPKCLLLIKYTLFAPKTRKTLLAC